MTSTPSDTAVAARATSAAGPHVGALRGKVAVVAGATRGAGRGIARALGEAGATVWCTGRSVRGHAATHGRPEVLEETAELVTAAGGRGVAVRVDHARDAEVAALFERVRAESGHVDVLVNDIWGGEALVDFAAPFWAQPVADRLALLRNASETHLLTARHGLPLMFERGGLVVEVTDGDTWGFRGSLMYDLAKNTPIRIAYGLHHELRGHGHDNVAAVAVTPGFLRSEAMLTLLGVTEANWRDAAAQDVHFLQSETPLFVGRAIACLAADPHVGRRSGSVVASWTLAREYGFVDADGARPDWGAYLDGVIADLLTRGAPYDAMERFLLQVRRWQLDQDPTAHALCGRLDAALAAAAHRPAASPGG